MVKSPMRYQADFILHTNRSPGAMVVTAAQFKSIPKAEHYARAMSNVLRAAQHLFEVEAKAMLLGAKAEANLVKARSRLQLATSRLIVSGLDGKLKNTGEAPSKTLTPKVLTNGDDFIWSEAIELAERNGYERDEARRECADLLARAEKAEAQLKLMRIEPGLESPSGWADVLEPKWLTQARSEVSGASPEVVDCACRLISGVASVIEARATLDVIYQNDGNLQSDQSHIRVAWKDSDLVWVVSSSNRPWPKVSVRFYEPNEPTTTLYLANEVVRQSIALLGQGY